MTYRNKNLNVTLPKWPRMYVTGVSIDPAQAKEIIRRTDTFFIWRTGNNRAWKDYVLKTLCFPEEGERESAKWFEYYQSVQKWLDRWGYIHTRYVCNSWISESYIGGPHGWCHPDGTIGYVDNVGKWPEAENVYEDWKVLAKEFPFLDIGVTLIDNSQFDSETEEAHLIPKVSFRVRGGKVRAYNPQKVSVHKSHPRAVRGNVFDGMGMEETMKVKFLGPAADEFEIGMPKQWIQDWAEQMGVKGW